MATRRLDRIGSMEAAYRLEGSGEAWLSSIVGAALPVIALPGAPVSALTFRVTPTTFDILDKCVVASRSSVARAALQLACSTAISALSAGHAMREQARSQR